MDFSLQNVFFNFYTRILGSLQKTIDENLDWALTKSYFKGREWLLVHASVFLVTECDRRAFNPESALTPMRGAFLFGVITVCAYSLEILAASSEQYIRNRHFQPNRTRPSSPL